MSKKRSKRFFTLSKNRFTKNVKCTPIHARRNFFDKYMKYKQCKNNFIESRSELYRKLIKSNPKG